MSEYIRVMQISNPRTENEIRKTANRTEKGALFPCTVMIANSNPYTRVTVSKSLVSLYDKDHAMSTTCGDNIRLDIYIIMNMIKIICSCFC